MVDLREALEKKLKDLASFYTRAVAWVIGGSLFRELVKRKKNIAMAAKIAAFLSGIAILAVSGFMLLLMLYSSPIYSGMNASKAISAMILVLSAISGVLLITALPESIRVRFLHPVSRRAKNPTYGFYTMVAIGVGTTIGSPLFVLIPENIVQYSYISVFSLLIAGCLSLGLAISYSYQYRFAIRNNVDIVGGSGFVSHSTGSRSLRYFITRISAWIANTALAAYSALLFEQFNLTVINGILLNFGYSSLEINIVVISVTIVFVLWFVVNAFFSERYLRHIGNVQIILVIFMVSVLVLESINIGFSGGWRLSGLPSVTTGNPAVDLIINVGYLYLIFFGFQEILSLNREGLDESRFPLGRRLFGRTTFGKEFYVPAAIILTVILSSAVNILFAVAVLSLHLTPSQLSSSAIPAIYIARTFTGKYWELLLGIVFLVASITTFVPAFLAASRHLGALSESGFFPKVISSSSWLITLVLIGVLYSLNANFLVSITDFMILISLTVISLSAIWIKKTKLTMTDRWQRIALAVSVLGIISAVSLYFIEPDVVLIGVYAFLLTYFFFDVLNLGTVGNTLFLLFLNLSALPMLLFFPAGYLSLSGAFIGLGTVMVYQWELVALLLASAFFLALNLLVDVLLIGRTGFSLKASNQPEQP